MLAQFKNKLGDCFNNTNMSFSQQQKWGIGFLKTMKHSRPHGQQYSHQI